MSESSQHSQRPDHPAKPQHRWRTLDVFLTFLRLGVTSFGGPTAHVGYFRAEFVGRRRWLDQHQFAELLALCQFLPGPASSQLGFAIGLHRAGTRGALAAWLAFTLPSALIMVAVALGAASFGGDLGRGLLQGLEAVAVAVVAHAVWSLARTLTPDLRRIIIAIGAATLALFVAGAFGGLIAIGFGLVAGLIVCRLPRETTGGASALVKGIPLRVGIVCLSALLALLVGLPLLATLTDSTFAHLADAFVRSGSLVFGTGHVMLPLLAAEPLITSAVTEQQMIAGYGAVQAVPGPLFTFAAYLGAIITPEAPVLGATVALVAVFLPGMLLLVGVLPFWNRLRALSGATAAIRGASAAVVGILAAALIDPIIGSALTGWVPIGIAAFALVLLFVKVPPWLIVITGAAAGALASWLGVSLAW